MGGGYFKGHANDSWGPVTYECVGVLGKWVPRSRGSESSLGLATPLSQAHTPAKLCCRESHGWSGIPGLGLAPVALGTTVAAVCFVSGQAHLGGREGGWGDCRVHAPSKAQQPLVAPVTWEEVTGCKTGLCCQMA